MISEHIQTERLQAAAGLGRRFIQRWDLYPKQLDDGRYVCVRENLTAEHLLFHLDGEITLGAYLMDLESQAQFAVLDADGQSGLTDLVELSRKLRAEGVPTYLETSRRGGHLWFFFVRPYSGAEVRIFGTGVLTRHPLPKVELYPKQDELGDGPGSLIRLPFGVHRKTGQRYSFITPDGELLAPTVREQIRILANPLTVPEDVFEKYMSYQPQKPTRAPPRVTDAAREASWETIKESINIIDFIGQYVDLKPTGSGAVGRCPFHDDQHPSFGVNEQGNYWHCFSGCGGGSVIDFWMKWRGTDFKTAVTELSDMVGGNHVRRNGTTVDSSGSSQVLTDQQSASFQSDQTQGNTIYQSGGAPDRGPGE